MLKKVLKNKYYLASAIFLVVLVEALIVSWWSGLYILDHLTIKEVTPTQMAAAMRNDEFWSHYRLNSLLFYGTIQDVQNQQNITTITFDSSDSYGVSCQITNSTTTFKVGETYHFAVETYQAQRQPNGVLLHNCVKL